MQLEPVLIRNEIITMSRIMQLIDSTSSSCVSRAQYYYWRTKHNDDTIPQVPNVDFAPNSRAVLGEKDCRRAF